MFLFEWSLGWRYFRSRRKHPFIGFISKISILGVAIGVASLIIVLAVMRGFEKDLIDRVVGIYAHMQIESNGAFEMDEAFKDTIQKVSPEGVTLLPYIQFQGLIEIKKDARGVLIKASEASSEFGASDLQNYLKEGFYPEEGSNEIFIGDVLSRALGVRVNDEIQLFLAEQKKPLPFIVSGIFHSGMYDYDANLVYMSLATAQKFLKLPGQVTQCAVKFHSPEEALEKKQAIQQALGYPFYVRTWKDMNANLFGALKLERIVMFIILTLIVLVACFNIIGTLTLLVMDKTKDIGILKALGAQSRQIRNIFAISGTLVGIIGTIVGLVIGVGVVYILATYSIFDLPKDIYYFDKLPVYMSFQDVALITISSLAITFCSTLYPAWMASWLHPVEALRYE